MNFAQRLKNARENAHILQKELSERSGVALRTIQNWETGVRRPSNIESVTKVAKVLGLYMAMSLSSYGMPSVGILMTLSIFCPLVSCIEII